MEKALASKILEAALALDKEINEIDSLISLIEDAREKEEFVDALGSIMKVLTCNIVFRVIREFPELDPDR
jgi:hypothetical protein